MKMLIGGKQVDASDGAKLDVINPGNLSVIDTVPMATKDDILTAITNASNGFKIWSETPLFQRITILQEFLKLYWKHSDELVDLLIKEVGKTVRNATLCVRGRGNFIDECIAQARTLHGECFAVSNRIGTNGDLVTTIREPVGIVAAIMPFNYPINMVANKVIPALLMGNAVIAKPASETPLSSIRFCELLLEAGVPGDVIQIVTGSGSKIGKWLIGDPRVAAVCMTGSTDVGIEIAKIAADNLTDVHLELGGNDPLIVLEGVDMDRVVEESIAGRTDNTGQVCISIKRFLVQNSIKKEFIDRLISSLKTKRIGDPSSDPSVDCGPMVSIKAAKDVEEQVEHCINQGAKLLLGGKRYNESYMEFTVIEATPEMDVSRDLEIFGPVFTIIGFESIDEAIEIANNSKFGLSSGVMGGSMQDMFKVAKKIQCGTCVINGTGRYLSNDQPFGGYKMSGIGREGVRQSLEAMSQEKTIVIRKVF